jgi:hypothetical protein
MKKLMFVGVFSVVAALTGCGAPAPVGSCQAPASAGVAYCIDYTGNSVTIDAVQQGCSGAMGTYQSAVCATASRVGRCTLPGGTAALTQTANFYAPATAEQAQAVCTALMGTYTAN